jgi:hypothetical protein
VGIERANRNSAGGDREKGGFGQVQSDFVHELKDSGQNYGQWLNENGWTGLQQVKFEKR